MKESLKAKDDVVKTKNDQIELLKYTVSKVTSLEEELRESRKEVALLSHKLNEMQMLVEEIVGTKVPGKPYDRYLFYCKKFQTQFKPEIMLALSLGSRKLIGESLTTPDVLTLCEVLKSDSLFVWLDLSGVNLDSTASACLGDVLRVNNTITYLNLSTCSVGDSGAVELGEGIRFNDRLTSLNLSSAGIGDAGAVALSQGLRDNKSVTMLDLGGSDYDRRNNIGDAGARAISVALRYNRTLYNLNMSCGSFNSISSFGARHIMEGLHSNTALGVLDLSRIALETTGVQALEDLLQRNRSLSSLKLESCSLYPELMPQLAKAILSSQSLTYVDLTDNVVKHGLTALCEVVRKSTSMKTLLLRKCRISYFSFDYDHGLRELAVSLRFSGIEVLNLLENDIRLEAAEFLRPYLKANRLLIDFTAKDGDSTTNTEANA